MVGAALKPNVLPSSPQCLKTKDLQDDMHASFRKLLSELHKQDAPYDLSVANRLYGERSYQFVEVCVCARVCMHVIRSCG